MIEAVYQKYKINLDEKNTKSTKKSTPKSPKNQEEVKESEQKDPSPASKRFEQLYQILPIDSEHLIDLGANVMYKT